MSPKKVSCDGLLFPKPKEWPNQRRKREIRRLDRKLSAETETGVCESCGRVGKTDPAHIIPRRYQAVRHDPRNIRRKCRACHEKEPSQVPKKTYNVFKTP